MPSIPVVGLIITALTLIGAFLRWLVHHTQKQEELLKAMGLGVHSLLQKSEGGKDDYVIARLRDALKD